MFDEDQFVFDHQEKGACHMFWESFCPLFVTTEIFWWP
jgi:hypothetical protein